ncbi:uncharacterized protein [Chiloscyllium punctatum]|uniref:uncharacterized protein isoform X4 n=1 Tax=Chiloscyllium punctatum TaxID=137246 RepID=UPI003B63F07E
MKIESYPNCNFFPLSNICAPPERISSHGHPGQPVVTQEEEAYLRCGVAHGPCGGAGPALTAFRSSGPAPHSTDPTPPPAPGIQRGLYLPCIPEDPRAM